jgi:hypothetical protein
MKKSIFLAFFSCAFVSALAQCPKYCFIELFTSANCSPSVYQDHYLRDSILTPNPNNIHAISFNTNWGTGSGSPIMYSHNVAGNDARFTYYGIAAVSNFKLQGNVKGGLPNILQQSDVDDIWANSSPLAVHVNETDLGTNRNVDVTVNTIGVPPSGTHRLFIALVEKTMVFTSPPGTNGDTIFSNVFLDMLNGNTGTHIDLAPTGSSYVHATINYPESWAILDTSELAVIAWVQDSLSKEVIQSGASFDLPVDIGFSNTGAHVLNGPASSSHTFNLQATNTTLAPCTYTFIFHKNAPADWTADFEINGTIYTDTAVISLPADSAVPVFIHATAGPTRSVGEFTLKGIPFDTVTPPITQKVNLISGITDLVVNNTSPQEIISDLTAVQYEYVYDNGLIYASNTGYGSTTQDIMVRAINDNAMTGINNIWLNVSNTMPTFSGDSEFNMLTSFLDGGGNLFISGQDIGYDLSQHPSPAFTSFYTNYLHASYLSDGTTADNLLTAKPTDAVFATIPSSVINDVHGGFYPDHILPQGTGLPVFYYNADSTKISGVRAQESTCKVVYISVGVEMLSLAVRNEIIKLSHDWFYGILGTLEYTNAMHNLSMQQNFPNPCNESTTIFLSDCANNLDFTLVDQLGKIILTKQITQGTLRLDIDTRTLAPGNYIYRIANKVTGNVSAKKLQVIH